MKIHVITAHFGPGDRTNVSIGNREVRTKIDLLSPERKLKFGLNDAIKSLTSQNIYPSELGLDLLIIASIVHGIDTRLSRSSESQDSWTREIRCVVPVSNPSLWQGATSLLSEMLGFLSGDKWQFDFRSRPQRFKSLIPPRPQSLEEIKQDTLCLFSGGLDSLIGVIDLLHAGHAPLLISHAGEGATSKAQNRCFAKLKAAYPNASTDRLRLWLNFPAGTIANVSSEKSTRARSFLFFSLGAFAGSGMNSQITLNVPENGLIALNVPLENVRLGALSTRTTHPFYMTRWNQLLSEIGLAVNVKNPYWNKTKGEMVKNCLNQTLLKSVSKLSLSCASPSKGRWKGLPTQHCGYCLPCLIRRASLVHAWDRDPTKYISGSLRNKILDPTQAEGLQVRAFQFAYENLALYPGVEKILIHKPGPLSDVSPQLNELAGVYKRGMDEVARVLRRVRTKNN